MRHFGSKDALRAAFEKIQVVAVAKNKPPNQKVFEHCKLFADFSDSEYWKTDVMEWSSLLRHCQNSFINLLEVGYILQSVDRGAVGERVFLLDFNKGCVNYYMNCYTHVLFENAHKCEFSSAKSNVAMRISNAQRCKGGLCKKELNKATLEEIMGFEDIAILLAMAEKFAFK